MDKQRTQTEAKTNIIENQNFKVNTAANASSELSSVYALRQAKRTEPNRFCHNISSSSDPSTHLSPHGIISSVASAQAQSSHGYQQQLSILFLRLLTGNLLSVAAAVPII